MKDRPALDEVAEARFGLDEPLPRAAPRPVTPRTHLARAILALAVVLGLIHALAAGTRDSERKAALARSDAWSVYRADLTKLLVAQADREVLGRFAVRPTAIDALERDLRKLGPLSPVGRSFVPGVYRNYGGDFALTVSAPTAGHVTGSVHVAAPGHPAKLGLTFEGTVQSGFATLDVHVNGGRDHVPADMRVSGDGSVVFGECPNVFPLPERSPIDGEPSFIPMGDCFFELAHASGAATDRGKDPAIAAKLEKAIHASTAVLYRGIVPLGENDERLRAIVAHYAASAVASKRAAETADASVIHADAEALDVSELGPLFGILCAAAALIALERRRWKAPAVLIVLGVSIAVSTAGAAFLRAKVTEEEVGTLRSRSDAADARSRLAVVASALETTRAMKPSSADTEAFEQKLEAIEVHAKETSGAALTPGVYVSLEWDEHMPNGTYLAVSLTGEHTLAGAAHILYTDGQGDVTHTFAGTAEGGVITLDGETVKGASMHVAGTYDGDAISIHGCERVFGVASAQACRFVRFSDPEVDALIANRPAALAAAVAAVHQATSARALRLVPDAAYEGALAALAADCTRADDAAERSASIDDLSVEGLREWVARSDMARWIGELASAFAASALLVSGPLLRVLRSAAVRARRETS